LVFFYKPFQTIVASAISKWRWVVIDDFLEIIPVRNEQDAMKDSIGSALRVRGKRVYRTEAPEKRKAFREEWDRLIRQESQRYIQATQAISDDQHCEVIRTISENLSGRFGEILQDGVLRYGVTQKALNLYLKYLWRLQKTAIPPPHCPVDGVALGKAGIRGSWTKSNSEKEYMDWIGALRIVATDRVGLSEWEYKVWMEDYMRRNSSKMRSESNPSCVRFVERI
jgi:hypothetical protein